MFYAFTVGSFFLLIGSIINSNKRKDAGGGALLAETDSGEVNLVECTLSKNEGTMGGAVYSGAFRLNIVSSSITANKAKVRHASCVDNHHLTSTLSSHH